MGAGAKGWEAALRCEQSKAWRLQESGHRKPRGPCPAQHLCQAVPAFSSPGTEQAVGSSRPLTPVSPCSQPSHPREALGLRLLFPRQLLSPRFPFPGLLCNEAGMICWVAVSQQRSDRYGSPACHGMGRGEDFRSGAAWYFTQDKGH